MCARRGMNLAHIPIEPLFRATWLPVDLPIFDVRSDVAAYLHWTRPNYFGRIQHFRGAIGVLSFRYPSGVYYLLGIIGKHKNKAPWDVGCIEGSPDTPWNHQFYLQYPNPTELAAFAQAWGFFDRLPGEIVIERYSSFDLASVG